MEEHSYSSKLGMRGGAWLDYLEWLGWLPFPALPLPRAFQLLAIASLCSISEIQRSRARYSDGGIQKPPSLHMRLPLILYAASTPLLGPGAPIRPNVIRQGGGMKRITPYPVARIALTRTARGYLTMRNAST